MKMSKSGGALVTRGGGSQEFGDGIAVSAWSIFWVDSYSPGFVKKNHRDGGTAGVLASTDLQLTAIVADAIGVSWTTMEGT